MTLRYEEGKGKRREGGMKREGRERREGGGKAEEERGGRERVKDGGYEGEKVNPLLCICIHVPCT